MDLMARVEVILDVKFYKAERDIKIKNINNGISPVTIPRRNCMPGLIIVTLIAYEKWT